LARGRQRRVLHFDEVADVHVGAQPGAAAQPGEGADQCARADAGAEPLAVDVRVRPQRRAGADGGIADDAVGADAGAVAELDLAFEDAADVDLDVAAADELPADVDARRVGEAHARGKQAFGAGALEAALQVGELGRAVDAEHLGLARRLTVDDSRAFGDGQADDVGQVVLAGGVVVAQRAEPAPEGLRRRGHDAGVDLVDGELLGAGVLVLDDADDRAVAALANDPAVTVRVGHPHREQGQVPAFDGIDERTQRWRSRSAARRR
jgi:hypothetical protein